MKPKNDRLAIWLARHPELVDNVVLIVALAAAIGGGVWLLRWLLEGLAA